MRFAITAFCLLTLASCRQRDRASDDAGRIRVDAGGHKLEFLIEGVDRGQPTVILEAWLGGGIESWSTVRPSLSKITRVGSYDRAGIGGSQPGPRPRSAARIVSELRAALESLKITPPYILVGHSVGGLYVRAYAGLHPEEVVGLVLVDPTMEFREVLSTAELDTRLQQCWGSQHARIRKLLQRIHPKMAAIAAQSLLELENYIQSKPLNEQPATRTQWLEKFEDHAQRIEGMLPLMSDSERQELFASMESMQLVRAAPTVNTPTTLLVAGQVGSTREKEDSADDPTMSADHLAWSQNLRLQSYREYIETIPAGQMKILHNAGHNIPKDRPDAIIDAVTDLLEWQRRER